MGHSLFLLNLFNSVPFCDILNLKCKMRMAFLCLPHRKAIMLPYCFRILEQFKRRLQQGELTHGYSSEKTI
ncbi:hypothetical protein SAMN06265361_11256 [Laceyella tengchongensis]|uniref:Uncharacterized protein n=1 Tax=Laceyella tengchongensis TaxID=574699 RepID=A0AA46AH65_9BACL|nr:hypothetical protein SAMN06265361_11256 [Laceyella tengchongensis]